MNLTTLRQKKPGFLLSLLLLVGFIALPFWVLSSEKKNVFFSAPANSSALTGGSQADSLFAKGQYEAALSRYRAQVWQQRQVSTQLLFRLAYAEHQQGHYAAELLYLNMALARQPRLSTWRQLVSLAQRQRLVGYPTTWQQEIRIQVQRYYYPVLQGLLSGAVLIVVALLLQRRRTPQGTWLIYGLYLLGTGAYLYWLQPVPIGIIAHPGVALMAGPSAGASWLSTTAPGDRLPVIGRQDIWLQVRWQERIAYVRVTDALIIE